LRYDRVATLGLNSCIVDEPASNGGCPGIQALADEPRPPGCRKVQGEEDLWRIRVGDYRVPLRAARRGVGLRDGAVKWN